MRGNQRIKSNIRDTWGNLILFQYFLRSKINETFTILGRFKINVILFGIHLFLSLPSSHGLFYLYSLLDPHAKTLRFI